MSESINQVIERMKAQREISQASKKETPKVEEKEFEGITEEDVQEEMAEEKPKEIITPEMEKERQHLIQIEMLQNDGRFRAEILFQFQELNKAIVTIAGILLDHGNK